MSDEKPGREEDPRAASDAELTDEQLDREAPGVEDAAELEAAEADVAAEAQARQAEKNEREEIQAELDALRAEHEATLAGISRIQAKWGGADPPVGESTR